MTNVPIYIIIFINGGQRMLDILNTKFELRIRKADLLALKKYARKKRITASRVIRNAIDILLKKGD